MSINKLALLRYKIIDECLQNHYRKWTLDDLVERVSDALYEYEGIKTGVSKRTIQLDLQLMRSDKLGYEAPIIVADKKYYRYADKNYSITRSKVSAQDVEKLGEVVAILKQFKGFTYFEDITEMVGRLEDKILKQRDAGETHIDFEKNELVKGLEWIDILLKAVRERTSLAIDYQSFKAKIASTALVYPYLLKEYRNRWFLLARKKEQTSVIIMALDRMVSVQSRKDVPFHAAEDFEVATFFDNIIGVTKTLQTTPSRVILKVTAQHAPYIRTKPLHASQQILKDDPVEGMIFEITVGLNYELEREILGFGEAMTVFSPRHLQNRIRRRLLAAVAGYAK